MKKSKACSACTYQRRKCTNECVLAPYFPADKPKMFGKVHRLFGVSNIQKILNKINDGDKRDDAMKSIIFESDIRAKFPKNGCLGVIKQYESLLKETFEELNQTNMLLAYCKQNNNLRQQNLHSSLPSTSSQIPMFNNYGDVPNYYHNGENNNMMLASSSSSYISDIIPYDVNNTLIDTNFNKKSTGTTKVEQLSGLSNSGDDDAKEDDYNLMVTKGLYDNEEFDGDKFGNLDFDLIDIDMLLNEDGLVGIESKDAFECIFK